MSKSRGNTVEPWEVLDSYGADAFRWYFFTSKQPWDGYRFSVETIGEGVRLFLKQLWSTYYFYALYARAAPSSWRTRRPRRRRRRATSTAGRSRARPRRRSSSPSASTPTTRQRRARDRGARRRALQLVRAPLAAALLGRRAGGVRDAAHVPAGGRASCSRRSARSSPMRSTTTSTASWRACTCATSREPERDRRARRRSWKPRWRWRARRCGSGCGARGKAKIKVRQPLGEAVVVADGREREAIERLVGGRARGAERRARPLRRGGRRARQLRGEGQLPHARPAVRQARCRSPPTAIAALDPAHVAEALRDGGQHRDLGRRRASTRSPRRT